MPREKEKGIGCSESKTIVDLLDELIQQIKEDQSLVANIRTRIGNGTRWHGFGFDTLVKDVLGPAYVDSMKQARTRFKTDDAEKNNSNYLNLKRLYESAQQKYYGSEKLPKIQSISDEVLRETKKLGIDWEAEMKKFSSHLQFRNTKL